MLFFITKLVKMEKMAIREIIINPSVIMFKLVLTNYIVALSFSFV
jgi:hypothetical protein